MVGGKNSNNGGGLGLKEIPAGSKKMLMSLKEIVNCPESEIYATLQDCNMDPNEAVNRLLSQDAFHEVKSKREKKKDSKDTSEGRPRGSVSTCSRGGRSGTGRYVKAAYKKDSGSTSYPASVSSVPGTISDSALGSNKASAEYTGDGILPVPQPSSSYKPGWGSAPGKMSMADIVKMGKPQNKSSAAPKASDVNPSAVSAEDEDEWPSIDVSPMLEPASDSKFHDDMISRHDHSDDIPPVDGDGGENVGSNIVAPASVSGSEVQEENADGTSLFDNGMYQNREPGVSVSSVTSELQELNIRDDTLPEDEDGGPSVVIPGHLQVQSADCSHLSFGSFKVGAPSSAPLTSDPVKTNTEEATSEADATRNSEYYGEESYIDVADGNTYHRPAASAVNYDSPSVSQQEPLKPQNPQVEHENRYSYPTSSQGYIFENTQQPNVASSQSHSGTQIQNNATFSNVMQAYSNSLPNTLLAANIHSGREIDLPFSPFLMNQFMPSKYANTASSLSASAMSMPEALKTGGYSSAQPTQQSLSGSNVAPGPGVPQHLAMHPYSQHTLPLGPFANMIGYPFLSPSYSYLPSAYQQQAFPGNNYNHQSLAAALLPQKMSTPVSSLPQSASVASGFGAYGSTTSLPGNFTMNQTAVAAPSGATINYDDVLGSQYKDNTHLMSLQQQSENAGMWLQGAGSRSMSAVHANTYYGIQGQNQQAVGLRQAQQPSQNYGSLGYPNFYHAQAGMSMDHQQQQNNPREGSLVGSQGQPKQSQQQLWQNSY